MSGSLQVAAVVSVVVLAASMVSVLLSVVVLTAVVPTAIARWRFTPAAEPALQRAGAPTASPDGPQR